MALQTIPARIRWAVEVLDVQPADQVLEIGCGQGQAAELICSRLKTGKLLAIDRSESGVDRTKRRCAEFISAGRLAVRHIDLRSEEHTSELQSLMRISYAVFCLKKKKRTK